jgi:DNA-binding FadR family transcriptional regulator
MVDRRNPTGTGLHDPVLEKLGMEIASGELPAGHVLTLDGIQERFGVSRTVSRETMRILQSMGLIQSRRRVGITVQPIDSWNVFDPKVIWWRLSGPGRGAQLRTLTELRIAVEPLAAGAAARAATSAQRSRVVELAAILRRLGEAGELTEFMERDVEFHALLLQASGNEMFGALADVVAAVLRGRTQLGLMPHKPVPQALDLHEAVGQAVAAGRSAEARTAMLPGLTLPTLGAAPPPAGTAPFRVLTATPRRLQLAVVHHASPIQKRNHITYTAGEPPSPLWRLHRFTGVPGRPTEPYLCDDTAFLLV